MTTTAPTNMVSITLNGQPLEVASGTTVLDAAKDFGLSIPTLCSNDRLRTLGACRLCLVEVDSEEQLHSACSFTLTDSVD
ncbi:MAG: 2Fe-2S iron-sulfur cluster binding domain-containing protein, partial [Candidatus Latescibacteria bacterium]|nr:2Fe-2S iron-sulfur cluster binding domain-containing protein [Candidatus Latescibacterota bacterium]